MPTITVGIVYMVQHLLPVAPRSSYLPFARTISRLIFILLILFLFCSPNAAQLHFIRAKTKYILELTIIDTPIDTNCLKNIPQFLFIFVARNASVLLFPKK